MKNHLIIIIVALIMSLSLLCGCDEKPINNDISPHISESFHTNASAPYRFWRFELNESTKIRVQGNLDPLDTGEIPRVDFVFFDGSTNDYFNKLSAFNASSIDKTWTVPYDGIFFVGIECKYEFLTVTGDIIIYL